MKCQSKTCTNEATGGVSLNVPAKDVPLPEHNPIRIVFGLQLCDKCVREADPKDFLNDPTKQIINIQVRHRHDLMGKEPDYSRAFITSIPYNSREWAILQRPRKT